MPASRLVRHRRAGLSYLDDVHPHEQQIEWWDGPVAPEVVRPDGPAWRRHRLHDAANLYHVQQRLGLTGATQRTYRVAWVGGCVLYDTAVLRGVGGFGFWPELPPEHCGEDVLAQLRVMAARGGCGIIPSGVYHQELPTTAPDRRVDAPRVLPLAPGPRGSDGGPPWNPVPDAPAGTESARPRRRTRTTRR